MSKGSGRRPQQITNDELARRWNETFEAHELRIQSHPKVHAHDTLTDCEEVGH